MAAAFGPRPRPAGARAWCSRSRCGAGRWPPESILIARSAWTARYLLHTGSALAWGAAGLLAAATLIGFVLSRTTGLPSASDDIGNWTEPLGLASMFVEGAVIVVAGYACALARHERRPGVHASVATPVAAER